MSQVVTTVGVGLMPCPSAVGAHRSTAAAVGRGVHDGVRKDGLSCIEIDLECGLEQDLG
ncbi:hypothetical protein AB0H83_45950 [Dactylosporangium sp. NPDC050688]|uniref:hypothetical protein n=1 Tax=Dactylosporangium sp. NPDC050688 TaxID=3157217 RepID=UPI0033EA80B3